MLTSLRVQNYRSFKDSGEMPLSPLTILVGRNNSGKSTLLRAIYQLQQAAPWSADDIRVGAPSVLIHLGFDRLPTPPFTTVVNDSKWHNPQLSLLRTPESISLELGNAGTSAEVRIDVITPTEPYNFIYPSLARRYSNTQYEEQLRRDQTTQVWPNETNLVARTSTLLNPRTRDGQEFESLCKRVFNQTLDLMTGDNGQRLGLQIGRFAQVGLTAMGTGISATLGLLVNLTGAKDKVFLIEEPENDLHPAALKALLDIIIEKSATNQFIISTHSSIVLTRLGAMETATVLYTDMQVKDDIPTSTVRSVQDRAGRLEVLRDLGYALADLGLSDGWLIFEESSAERLCRQYLIPWFVPALGRLTTIAAAGTSRLGPLWQNLHEMALFAHLQPESRDRLWVIADGDSEGTKAVNKLAKNFDKAGRGRFHTWQADNFEKYYPAVFAERARIVLALPHDQRPGPKSELLNDVLAWISEDVDRAREAFKTSAADAIHTLREVSQQVSAALSESAGSST